MDEYLHAIYPRKGSGLRYATAGVYFEEKPATIDYHVWTNQTYTSHVLGYGKYETRNGLLMTIQNEVESAINAVSNPSMKKTIISFRNNPYIYSQSQDRSFSFEWHRYIIGGCGMVFTLYWGVLLINEKKGSMMSYMRSMGMMESSVLMGYLPMFFLFSVLSALLTELVARMLSDPYYQLYSFGVSNDG